MFKIASTAVLKKILFNRLEAIPSSPFSPRRNSDKEDLSLPSLQGELCCVVPGGTTAVYVASGLSDYEQYRTTWAAWNSSDTSVNEIQFFRTQISTAYIVSTLHKLPITWH